MADTLKTPASVDRHMMIQDSFPAETVEFVQPVGPRWSHELEGVALDIAGNPASSLRVSAGPGTGKSFALMRRIARLIEEGADPSRILVITFTRTAARALARDLASIAVEGVAAIVTGTLHSYGFRTLTRAEVLAFNRRSPRMLLDFERTPLFEDLKIPKSRTMKQCQNMVKAFEADWARLQHEIPGWPLNTDDKAFHDELMDWMQFHECMLLGELPTLMLHYLRENPAAPERSAFDHVPVDEYQDLNRADQVLIDLLASRGTLTVVGDEDQSIYGRIRHAHPEGIRNFEAEHPDTESLSMDVCRRCPPQVVEMANNLISVNRGREPRILTSLDPDKPGLVRVVQWNSVENEISGIAEFIDLYLGNHPDLSPADFLVLSPRQHHGKAIASALNGRGVPAISYFLDDLFKKNPSAQQQFTLLTHVVRPDDKVAIRKWLSFDYSDGASKPYAEIRRFCESKGASLGEAFDAIAHGDLKFANSNRMLERWQALQQATDAITDLTGQALIDALFPDDQESLQDLRNLTTRAQDGCEGDVTPQAIYDAVMGRVMNPEPPEADGHVRVMSAFKAKGLTVKFVVVAGAVQSWSPTLDKNLSGDELRNEEAEQRRLFYVAITRPSQGLVISSFTSMPSAEVYSSAARARRHRGRRGYGAASQFIAETGAAAPGPILGADLLVELAEA